MNLESVNIYKLEMDLVSPFATSFGTQSERHIAIIEVVDSDGLKGYGECVAGEDPLYSEEFGDAALVALIKYFIPIVLNSDIKHPDEVFEVLKPFKKNNMAKSAIEGAVWDLFAKQQGVPMYQLIGGEKTEIEVGVSLGLEDTDALVVDRVREKVAEGYRRIKVKIKPGRDVELIRSIRKEFPDVPLMADANSAYTLDDLDVLKALDEFNLMMIEQPLAAGDLLDHAELQSKIETPICLDESVDSLMTAEAAIKINSGKIINLKIGRVGGISESIRIHDLCKAHGIPLWCGGMLEAGVGRMHNIAITTLSNFTMPGDTASSSRYWTEDIINPEVIAENGIVTVSDGVGIGANINFDVLEKYLVETISIDKAVKPNMIFK